MDFANEVAIGISVMLLCFIVLSGFILIRQRRRRRRNIHWLSVLFLSGLIGIAVAMGVRFSGSDPVLMSSDVGGSVDLNQAPGRSN